MGDEMKRNPKPSLDDLLQHSKIVSPFRGYLGPKEDNLKKILGAVDSSKFSPDLPVAILAVIGPKGSGKSFLTNFLIQYLRAEGEGGWMSSITKKGELTGRGFSWGSVSNQDFYEPVDSSAATSGVYLWPEPFLMKKSGGAKEIVVWIMHIHPGSDGKDLDKLEKFLTVACSRIVEIHCTKEDFRILDHHHHISSGTKSDSSHPISLKELCDSVVVVNRSETKAAGGTDEESKKAILKLMEDSGKDKDTYKAILDQFKHVNCFQMKNYPGDLHTNSGVLDKKALKVMTKCLKEIVGKTLDEAEILPKVPVGAEDLTLGNMHDFLGSVAEKIGTKNAGETGEAENKITTYVSIPDNRQDSNLANSTSSEEAKQKRIKGIRARTPEDLTPAEDEKLNTDMMDRKATVAPKVGVNDEQKGGSNEETKPVSEHLNGQEIDATRQDGNPGAYQRQVHVQYSQHYYYSTRSVTARYANGSSDRNGEIPGKPVNPFPHGSNYAITVSSSVPAPPLPDYHRQGGEDVVVQMETDAASEDVTPTTNNTDNKTSPSVIHKPLTKTTAEAMEVDDSAAEEAAKRLLEEEVRKRAQKEKQEVEKAVTKAEQDMIKKQKEEERRREEEEARSVLEQCFNTAVSQMNTILPSSIDYWINNHLNIPTINQMETIYAKTIHGITEEHRGVVHPKLWKEFVIRFDGHCKDECIKTLRNIGDPLLKINSAIKRQFSLHGYLSQPKLEHVAAEAFENETKNIDTGFVRNMIALANERLLNIYQQHNLLIFETEKDVVKIAMNQVMDVYREQMNRYLKEAPYSPQKLQNIHSTLVEKLCGAFKNACHLSSSVDEAIAVEAISLKDNLGEAFSFFKEANNNKLKKLQREITKIIQGMRTQYNEKVEDMLNRNPDGLDMKTLGKHHTAIQTEVMKLLEMEIRTKIRSNEPLESHQKVLQNHIDSYWFTVMDANKKNLKKAQERFEIEEKERKKLEAQRQLEEQQREAERKRARASNAVTSCNNSKSNSSRSAQNSRKSEDSRTILPPLVFHLQSSRIVMAMGTEGHLDVLKNESGEEQTPAVIVYDNGSFIFGTEALAFIESQEISNGKFSWSLGNFFLENPLTWDKSIRIGPEYYDITDEFLLAFLLRKLKHGIECEMNGRCSTATLAIPFWLSSTQRIKVKDGARLAGFSEVYLINEASAAAYNFVIGDVRPKGRDYVLVISENLDRVDAFVYDYNGYEKKIKMIGHSSNYTDEKRKMGLRKTVTKGVSSLINYIASYLTTQETEKNDHLTSSIRDACKLARERARTELDCSKMEINEYLLISENLNKWGMTLETVARDFGRKAYGIKENTAVLFGAVSVGKHPKEIVRFVRDKLAYDVQRWFGVGGTQVISKEDVLPLQPRKYTTTLSRGHNSTTFYQFTPGRQLDIGGLYVDGVRHSQSLEASLEITNEAIVTLKDVKIESSNAKYNDCSVASEQVQWKTPNLSAERLDELAALLDFFTQPPAPKEDPELNQAKAGLLQKCREMTEKVETGQFKIKSSLVKDMVLKTISEARQFAEHENSSLEVVQKQIDALEKLCEKYDKK